MPRKRGVSFDFLVDELLLYLKCTKAKRTHLVAVSPCAHLLKTFRGKPAGEANSRGAWAQHVARARAENPKRSLNKDRKLWRQILFFGYESGYLDRPPPRIPKPDPEGEVGRELSDKEIDALVTNASNPKIKFQIKVAFLTGMRKGEILNLEWSWIDVESASINIPPQATKTRRGRMVPICQFLLGKFLERQKASESRFVFPAKHNPHRPQSCNNRDWVTTKLLAKVKCRFNDLRHTNITRRLRAGTSPFIASKIVGNSEKVLKRIYEHLSINDIKNAACLIQLPKSQNVG